MSKFLARLASQTTLVADGATGTNLQKRGLKPGTPPEELVLDQPDWILDLASAFVEAGSDIILTCTFGGTRIRLRESQYADRVSEINRCAAELARQAASARPDVLVAGSIGPTGVLLQPYGPLSVEEAESAYREQVQALVQGGVDLLLIETHFSFEEADAAFRAARSVTDLPIVVSFSYDRGVRTMMGVKPADMIRHYKAMGAAMVGANCGTTLENMEKIIQDYASAEPAFPLWAKPNAGLPRLEGDVTVFDISPSQMAEFARRYVESGARVVGGCCGSTPEHVAAIVQAVK
ncbi:MAG: homocysteine S-methyltransferase family protein [Anaerolineales bacterium]|nr:homocysteine S-methyltransferase family protein [Anaerolineales bacterium]MCX7608681.1 homocysteine S-methyltransferase family protein [Anaerolineales bacterium]